MLYTIKGAGHNMLQKCQNVQLLDIRPRECIKKCCPWGNISQYTPLGSVYDNMVPVNIDSVKINTCLIMMREWPILALVHWLASL